MYEPSPHRRAIRSAWRLVLKHETPAWIKPKRSSGGALPRWQPKSMARTMEGIDERSIVTIVGCHDAVHDATVYLEGGSKTSKRSRGMGGPILPTTAAISAIRGGTVPALPSAPDAPLLRPSSPKSRSPVGRLQQKALMGLCSTAQTEQSRRSQAFEESPDIKGQGGR